MFDYLKNFFSKQNIYNIPNHKKGDKLLAKDLNKINETIEQMGQAEISTEIPDRVQPLRVKMFAFIRLEKDVAICNAFNGTTRGEDEIKIALPFILRKTPFDSASDPIPELRDGIEYTYTFTNDDDTERFDKRTSIIKVAGEEDDEEIQVIVSPYYDGDIVYAMAGIQGGTGVYHDEAKEKPVLWLQIECPKEWAFTSEEEDEEVV